MPVLGICNGFQVLTEAGLLPGALMRNAGLSFICRTVALEGRHQPVALHQPVRGWRDDRLPVAHHDGNYTADETTLDRLEGEGRVAFRYSESSTAPRVASPASSTMRATCSA